MSQNNYAETEQAALEDERKEQNWQAAYGKLQELYIRQMDLLLLENTVESRMQLKEMFQDPTFVSAYQWEDTFADMGVVIKIYEREELTGVIITILDQGSSVKELLDYMFQFRMLLYRLDFGVGEDTEEEFIAFLKRHNVSAVQMEMMLQISVMRKWSVAAKLKNIFKQYKVKEYAFFLERLEEIVNE